jgi:SMI1-KNR4 cell-wall
MPNYDMSEYIFGKFEIELGIKFPKFYKDVLLNYPESLIKNEYGNQFLTYDYKDLLANFVFHSNWFSTKTIPLPRNFFPIGCDYGGNPFFISLDEGNEKIYMIWLDEAKDFYDEETETVNWEIAIREWQPNISEFLKWLETYLSDDDIVE